MTSLSDGLEKLEQIVRPLEWSWESPFHVARVLNGHYAIEKWEGVDRYDLIGTFLCLRGAFVTLAEAKAAAEADYRARIASALNLDPILSEIKRMREALAQIGEIHRNLSIIDALASDRLTGHILRAREIADEALSTLSPQEPDNG
jgi:hypothetical protein